MTTRLEQLVAEARKLSAATKRTYLTGVRSFIVFAGADPRSWTPNVVDSWAKAVMATTRCKPQTMNTHLAGVKWASKRGREVDGTPDFARPVESFPLGDGTPGAGRTRPRALSHDETQLLLATCAGGTWKDHRDRAILCLGLRMGLRRAEIAGLPWTNLTGNTLAVTGKGGRTETLTVDAETAKALRAWKKAHGQAEHPHPTAMFYQARGLVGEVPAPLTGDGVYKIVKARAKQAGLENVHPHTMRHTTASQLLARGVAPWRVQKHMRHRSPVTTGNYIHDVLVDTEGAVGDALPAPPGDNNETEE